MGDPSQGLLRGAKEGPCCVPQKHHLLNKKMRVANPPRTGPMGMEFRHTSLGCRLACVWDYVALGIFSHDWYHFLVRANH